MLDYKVTGLKEWVGAEEGPRFDVVLDCVSGKTLEDAWTCVKGGGVVISVAQPPETKKPAEDIWKDVRGMWFIVSPTDSSWGKLRGWLRIGNEMMLLIACGKLRIGRKCLRDLMEHTHVGRWY